MAYNSKYTGQEVDSLLDKINDGNVGEIDDALSTTSENPVMNRVVTSELGLKATKVELEESTSLLDSEKANTSGYYPELHVGLSDNLLDRGDIVEGAIGFRASAGEDNSIEDGVANVRELLGDSVVWNQMFGKGSDSAGTWDGNTLTINGSYATENTTYDITSYNAQYTAPIAGHKYYLNIEVISGTFDGDMSYVIYPQEPYTRITLNASNKSYQGIIGNLNASRNYWFVRIYSAGSSFTNVKVVHRIYDLTQMFGSGNEPSTIDEFNAFCNQLVGVDLNAYNAGEVIGVNANGFKSVNDNAWNEEWRLGSIDATTGDIIEGDFVMPSDYIKVLPNEQYAYIDVNFLAYGEVFCYDAQKNYIGRNIFVSRNDNILIFRTPNNCSYILFRLQSGYGTTYNNDICIRLAHSGYKTDYVAHEESEVSFDLSEYFPYGMHGIGEVRDSATSGKATRRFGRVDLGTLDWGISDATYPRFYSYGVQDIKSPSNTTEKGNVCCSKYVNISASDTYYGIIGISVDINHSIKIYDPTYTDATTFKTAMSGVMLYYELAEPIETEIDPKQNYNYEVWDFGTEEMLSDVPSMPVITRTIYGFNATDTIRGNKTKNEEQDERLTTLEGEVVREGDYSPNNTVGFADDLAGHGESVPAEFSFRATGGKSIKDGIAWVKRIKGNSVVWNQQVNYGYVSGDTVINDVGSGIPQGHKFILSRTKAIGGTYYFTQQDNYSYVLSDGEYAKIFNQSTELLLNQIYCTAESGYVRLTDLTKMFGAGNEPTTIEEFYSRSPLGVDMNAYNEGEVIHMNVDSIKSIGDNAWDEQWENGTFDITTGADIVMANQIRSKNLIKILPNNTYFGHIPTNSKMWIIFFDEQGNVISTPSHSGVAAGNSVSIDDSYKTFTTPSNATYMRFYMTAEYGDTYKHDITISLYHSGWKAEVDGTYKPYWEDVMQIDSRIKNAFPEGMMSAGNAHDLAWNENGKGYTQKRIGKVDMGTLDWVYLSNNHYFFINAEEVSRIGMAINKDTSSPSNVCCEPYIAAPTYDTDNLDKVMTGPYTSAFSGKFMIKDTAYTDASSFKAAMQGVYLYYELAEPQAPIEYDTPFEQMDYKVADFGTEQAISETQSAPFNADTIYQFNAVDMIRENYNTIQEILARLTAAGI